jgi:hypothetical protein
MHRLSLINPKARTGVCSECGPVKLYVKESTPTKIKWRCGIHASQTLQQRKRKHLRFRKTICERCKFIPEDICQLDVHHIDGNHDNNEKGNHQTLCANCHRLITKRARA